MSAVTAAAVQRAAPQAPAAPAGGRPLSPALRGRMEPAFGERLDGVRLHLGSELPRAYHAAAVTIGDDVHIAPAQPSPDCDRGRFLLAHELAHVVQQRHGSARARPGAHGALLADAGLEAEAWEAAGAVSAGRPAQLATTTTAAAPPASERPAQPAVGFEFAIGWSVNQRNWGPGTHQLPKYAKLHYGAGWRMEADGNDIEFVVDPIEEGAGHVNDVIDVMDDLEDFIVNDMLPHAGTGLIRDAPFVTERWWGVQVQTDNDISGNPQLTAGVRQDRLITLYRNFAGRDAGQPRQLAQTLGGQAPGFYTGRAGHAVAAAAAVDANRPGHVPSVELQGLLALISQYLEFGAGTAPLQAVKYMTWIMSRTQFGHLLGRVPEAAYYRNHRADWVSYVCTDVMTAATGVALASGGRVVERPITDGGALAGAARGQIPVTRRQWLEGMLDGRDLLTAAEHPVGYFTNAADRAAYLDSRANIGHRLRGLGALGTKMDDTSAGAGTGVILEFRAAETHVPHGQWRNWALRCHRFITVLNASGHPNADIGMRAPPAAVPPPVVLPPPVLLPAPVAVAVGVGGN